MLGSDSNQMKGSANMATVTISKYDMMKVGDRIVMTKSTALVKSGVISEIKKVNQYAKTIKCDNGAEFHITKWNPNSYEIFRTIERN